MEEEGIEFVYEDEQSSPQKEETNYELIKQKIH